VKNTELGFRASNRFIFLTSLCLRPGPH